METIVVGILVASKENGQNKIIFYYRTNQDKNKIRMQVRQKLKSEFKLLKDHFKLKKPYIFLLECDAGKYCTVLKVKIKGKEYLSVAWGDSKESSKKDAELVLFKKTGTEDLSTYSLELVVKHGKILDRKEFGKTFKKIAQTNLIK